jgi:fatty acid desaturase
MKLWTACRVCLALALLSALAVLAANMTIQAIYHGETGLTPEWAVLRISFLVLFVFHTLALLALWKMVSDTRRLSSARVENDGRL